jgi:hypothetical protein
MTKLQTLLVSAAAGVAALATVSAASAGVVTLSATDSLKSYYTTSKVSVVFDYSITGPAKDLTIEEYVGDTPINEVVVGPFSGTGAYDLPGVVFKGVTIDYQLTAVPEPAAWAMMLVGFGGVGAAMRRRSVKTLAA